MEIKKGYNDKVTTINIYGRNFDNVAEFWIEQKGLPHVKETLSYISLDELVELKREVDNAIKKIAKL